MADSGSAEPSILSLTNGMEDDKENAENEEEVTFENLHDLIVLE